MKNSIFNDSESLFKASFDMQSDVIYYPVRHHSPACSYHLISVIEDYRPEVILIEGAADADFLIPYLADEKTVPPVCIYYSYDDKKGIIDDSHEKYRAYYPFLEYSPEMTAIRVAENNGIDVHFIDMPYADMLVNTGKNKLQLDFGKDDYENEIFYTEKVAYENNCRNFSEFWESRFEIPAADKTAYEFVRGVTALGYYMRQCGHNDESEHIKNAQREKYMSGNIAEYRKKYSKILVVAGAYHIAGLLSPETKLPRLKKCDSSAKALYLMPYSFLETDSKSGYGPGIPFPSFYQKIWKRLSDKNIENPYEETVLEYIIKTARYTRTKQPVSVPDEINAMTMAKSLANLRDKSSAGVYELTDAVRSTFVKGDINISSSFELDFLYRQLTGMGMGSVAADESIIPPVVEEFHMLCKKYRIKTNSIAYQDMTLETVKKPSHYEKSCFLHRMEFLNTGFCKMLSGADYVNNKDRNLIREQWRCRYSTGVETALTDLSVFGASISQICISLAEKQFSSNMTSSELGKLMIHIHVMGMNSIYDKKNDFIRSVILSDNNFTSVCDFILKLRNLAVMQKLRNGNIADFISEYINLSFERAVLLLDKIKNADDDIQDEVCKGIKMLYSMSLEYDKLCSCGMLCDELEKIAESPECKPQIYGLAEAVLFKAGRIGTEGYGIIINSYLETAENDETALFLCGMFMAGRDIIFTDSKLLGQIDRIVSSMNHDEFMAMLPQMRYAFTNFIPAETERISKMIAERYNTSSDEFSGSYKYSIEETAAALNADRKAADNLKKWRLY